MKRVRLSPRARWSVAAGGGAAAVIALVLGVLAIGPSDPSTSVAAGPGDRTENTSGRASTSTATPTETLTPFAAPNPTEVPLSDQPAPSAPVTTEPTTAPEPAQAPAAPTPGTEAAAGTGAAPAAPAAGDTAMLFPQSPKPYLIGKDLYNVGPASESTWELWFSTTTPGGTLALMSDKTMGDSTRQGRLLEMMGDGTLRYSLKDAQVQTQASYADGRWHHVAASVGPAGMKVYVDGQLVVGNPQAQVGEMTAGYPRVGGDRTSYFSGSLDEVAFYSSQLTDDQVRAHFAARAGTIDAYTAAVVADRPWLLWHLNDTAAGGTVTLADASGQGHTGEGRAMSAGTTGAAGAVGQGGVPA